MPHSKIEMPAKMLFSTEYPVLITDMNAANHMGADRIMPVVIEAQLRFLQHLGSPDGATIDGVGHIMVESTTEYLAQARYGDVLRIEVGASAFGNKTVDLIYRLSKLASDAEVARVRTVVLFYDYQQRAAQAVPEAFRARCG
jgi:acyl-CoA thioesterase FadM